jgi:hypothetical protein
MTGTEFSFWLIPSLPEKESLQATILELSEKYATGTGAFEPHVTVYSGPSSVNEARRVVSAIAGQFGPLTLVANRMCHSPAYTKTLFMEFEPSPELRRLEAAIRASVNQVSTYVLNPHLSLMYSNGLDDENRESLCRELTAPSAAISFDSICVIETEVPLQNGSQVKRWETIAPVTRL